MFIKETAYTIYKNGKVYTTVTVPKAADNYDGQQKAAERLRADYPQEKGYVVLKINSKYRNI